MSFLQMTFTFQCLHSSCLDELCVVTTAWIGSLLKTEEGKMIQEAMENCRIQGLDYLDLRSLMKCTLPVCVIGFMS